MAGRLAWNDGEGYDIHVLRGMPPSKALDGSLTLDPDGLAPFFDPHFSGAPNNLGVAVNIFTGEVTAAAQRPPAQPQFPNFNFLMTARQTLVGSTLETVIRIHVHDSIKKIWLTPSSLTVHEGADARFTVLALFGDDTVGDITDWPQLTYDVPSLSSLPIVARALHVLNRGEMFKGEEEIIGGRVWGKLLPDDNPDPSFDVTVALKSSSPAIDLSATAKVFVRPSWIDTAKDANTEVKWVAGPFVPNPNDFDSPKPDSITSVFKRANILFISEGFTSSQEQDFRKKVVELTVKELRTEDAHEPFKLLKESINYWSVFIPSMEEGIGILGENEISGTSTKQVASAVPLPAPPVQSQWTIENMIHEAGLPLPGDAPVANAVAWPGSRTPLFDIPPAVSVDAKALSDWNDLKLRTLLNERNTAFGMAHYDRPRASGQGVIGEEHLAPDPRRINEGSIKEFVENLHFSGFPIGAHWEEFKPDFGRVCFVCLSSKTGGTATRGYFAAGTGQAAGAGVTAAATAGTDVKPRRIDSSFSIPIYASVVSHECGHALGLGDEYGGNDTFDPKVDTVSFEPNLQPDTLLMPIKSNIDKIKWLWPRVSKAGVLEGTPDFQGAADPVQFLVRLRLGDGKPFTKGDLVRIRVSPVQKATAADPFAGILLKIDLPVSGDVISVTYVNPGGPHIDQGLFNASKKLILICTSIKPNVEVPLVAGPILNEIANRDGPLNAPGGQACMVGKGQPVMTPRNLPPLSKRPPTSADIIGLYEGGRYHDCGVFRPAGRCRMRSGFDATSPFCHVCRYIIVDAIDPTRHGKLDSSLYDKFYPA